MQSLASHRLGSSSQAVRPSSARRVTVQPCRCSAVNVRQVRSSARVNSFAGQRLAIRTPGSKTITPRQARGRTAAVSVQANLFARLTRVIKSYVDGFVGQFEDPDKLLDRVVDEMTTDATRMRQAAAQAIASQRQMQARADNMQAGADQWLRRAELAVARNQDDLAREALGRRKAMQQDADRLKEQSKAQQNAVDQLSASVRMLEGKINEARNKKETLKARAMSAKSNIAVQELIGGLRSQSSSSFAAFEKMEEKVMALEAEAQGVAALSVPDNLEARFEMLEAGGGVEDELKALKASQQGSSGQNYFQRPRMDQVLQPARGSNRQPDQLDMELEELRRRARG